MTDSNIRLLGATIFVPIRVALALAVAISGCTAQLSTSTSPPLATVPTPFGIAVDATTIYVTRTDPSPVLAVPIGGGAATSLGVSGAGRAIVADGQRLYWNNGYAVVRCDTSNCAATMVTMAPAIGLISDMKVDATAVYWTETPDLAGHGIGDVGLGRVMKMDKNAVAPPANDGGSDGGPAGAPDGGAPIGLPVQIAATGGPYNVAVDAVSVYWLDQSEADGGVWKAPLAGGPAVHLAVADQYSPNALALDDDNAYFADGAGTLFKAPKTGGPAVALISDPGMFPSGLATDATTLYIAAPFKLVSLPLAGGPVRTLAVGLAGTAAMALDATSVYVTDDSGNAIVKVSK